MIDEAQARDLAAPLIRKTLEPSAVACRPIEGGWRCWEVLPQDQSPALGSVHALVRAADGATDWCAVGILDRAASQVLAAISTADLRE